jgi:hypothetical protein
MGQDGGHWGREQHLFCCVILDFISLGIVYLVGGFNTPLKNMKVSWDDYSQYMEK